MTIGSCELRPDLVQVGIASLNTSPRFNTSQSGEPLRSIDAPLAIVLTGALSLRPSLLSLPAELLTYTVLVSELGVIFVQPAASRLTAIIRRGSISSTAALTARRVAFFVDREWPRRARGARGICTRTSRCDSVVRTQASIQGLALVKTRASRRPRPVTPPIADCSVENAAGETPPFASLAGTLLTSPSRGKRTLV